jgi:glycosyltransferase involved in cell wall biosynthesis
MRLLVVSPGPSPGGAEHYAFSIGIAAIARGWEVHAAFPHTPENETFAQDFRVEGATTHHLLTDPHSGRAGSRTRGIPRAATKTLRLVRRVRPDALHVTLPWPDFAVGTLLASAVAGVPAVAAFQLVPDFPAVSPRLLPGYRWMRRRGHRWVAVSEHGRRLLAWHLRTDPQDLVRIYNGVELPPPADGDDGEVVAAARAEWGLPQDAPFVLAVGRLARHKGLAALMEAIPTLVERFPALRLLIVGEGEERPRLEALVSSLGLDGTVQLTGQRSDVGRLMRAADLFVFPSHFEGFPFALLEAMSYGLPVVSADFGGAREFLSHRENGLLSPVGDGPALRDNIAWALANPAPVAVLARRGRETVAKFSVDAMTQQTLTLLSDVARRR